MSIEQNYLKKIEAIKGVADSLSKFETKFIFGDSEGRPIGERPSLSDKQKAIIDSIYKEKVEKMDRASASTISFGNDRVSALIQEGSKTYRVVIDRMQVGPVVNFAEATAVVSYLSAALNDNHIALSIPGAEAADVGGFPGEADA